MLEPCVPAVAVQRWSWWSIGGPTPEWRTNWESVPYGTFVIQYCTYNNVQFIGELILLVGGRVVLRSLRG